MNFPLVILLSFDLCFEVSMSTVTDTTCGELDCLNDTSTSLDMDIISYNTSDNSLDNYDTPTTLFQVTPTVSSIQQTTGTVEVSRSTIEADKSVPTTTDSTSKKEKHISPPDSCICDHLVGECEINCCCDADCKPSDIQVFAHCLEDNYNGGPSDYCLTTDIIYRNTTVYTLRQSENRLFCIDTHNLPNHLKYISQKIIKTTDGFKKLLKHHKLYQWTPKYRERNKKVQFDAVPYKFGSDMLLFENISSNSLSYLSIPSLGTSSVCHNYVKVRYLEEVKTSCLLKMPENGNKCLRNDMMNPTKYCNWNIIVSPDLFNHSNVSRNATKKFQIFHCSQEFCNATKKLPHISYELKENKCINTLKSVKYTFIHNGTNGIVNATCHIETSDITLSGGFTRLAFSVQFKWAKESKERFSRSGRPGYITGKPLISGYRKKGIDAVDDFHFSKESDDWISVPSASSKGLCSKQRNLLAVGENIKSECIFKIPLRNISSHSNCSDLQNQILEILFGKRNWSEEIWLSSWGDPDSSSWAPLLVEPIPSVEYSQKKCLAVAANLNIRIVTSRVGPVWAAQTKLIAASAIVTSSAVKCVNIFCHVPVITTVTFTDASPEPIATYAKPPVIRINLPNDFFYPFSSGKSSHIAYNAFVIFLSFSLAFLLPI